jgi:glycerate dehydrogenase
MTRIVFLDRDTIAPQIALPVPAFDHTWENHARTAPDQTAARLADADIAVTNKVRIGQAELDAAPNLKFIAVAATGYDCVDVAACAERGVAVANIRGYSVNTVPEHVFTLLLALRRSLVPYVTDTRDGAWQRAGQFCFFDHPIRDLAGATMGIVGMGGIGSRVADLARAFGMEVIFAARPGQPSGDGRVAFADFCARADVISLHCPLTDATRGLLGADAFARMDRAPIVLNTARGALIDLPALEAALDAGQVSGAGIDVADREPPAADDILMRLADHPRVLVTPHVAWASDTAQQTLSDQLGEVLAAFHRGAPINLVTPAG